MSDKIASAPIILILFLRDMPTSQQKYSSIFNPWAVSAAEMTPDDSKILYEMQKVIKFDG